MIMASSKHKFTTVNNIGKMLIRFLYENARILIKISLKFVPYGPINNIPALVQIAGQATSHYLNQWWLDYWRIYVSLGRNESRAMS